MVCENAEGEGVRKAIEVFIRDPHPLSDLECKSDTALQDLLFLSSHFGDDLAIRLMTQILFTREMPVEGTLCHTRLFGNESNARSADTFLGDQTNCRGDDLISLVLAHGFSSH